MARNKLSPSDRIKKQFERVKKPIEFLSNGNPDPSAVYITKIRQKVLQDFCCFISNAVGDYTFLSKHTKEISQITGFSERKVYDFINTLRFIEECSDVGFKNKITDLSRLATKVEDSTTKLEKTESDISKGEVKTS